MEVDLLHVNCEGCEWEMLENMLDTQGLIAKVWEAIMKRNVLIGKDSKEGGSVKKDSTDFLTISYSHTFPQYEI